MLVACREGANENCRLIVGGLKIEKGDIRCSCGDGVGRRGRTQLRLEERLWIGLAKWKRRRSGE